MEPRIRPSRPCRQASQTARVRPRGAGAGWLVFVPAEGGSRELIAEVQQHLGDDRVRAVAMDSTDGLARGVEVVDTGDPITVPVGEPTLGRLWNVVGEPIDKKDAPAGNGERRPIHRDPPEFQDLSAKIEIFETG